MGLSINDTQHSVMLSVTYFYYSECRYCYAECRFGEFRYDECGLMPLCSVIMPSVILLGFIMLHVLMTIVPMLGVILPLSLC